MAGRFYGIPVKGTHAHSWIMIYDDEVTRRLREIQDGYIARSEPVDLERWRGRHVGRRFVCNVAQLFSPVL